MKQFNSDANRDDKSRAIRLPIIKSVYLLIIAIIAIGFCIIGAIWWQNQLHYQLEHKSEAYYRATDKISSKILGEFQQARNWFAEAEIGRGTEMDFSHRHTQFRSEERLNNLLYFVDRRITEIVELQQQYEDEIFANSVKRLILHQKKLHESLQQIVTQQRYDYLTIKRALSPVVTITHQIQRLHEEAYLQSRIEISMEKNREARIVVILIAVLLGIGLILTIKILGYIRQVLSHQQHTYAHLQASERQVRLLLNSTGEAIYGEDLHGVCTFVNPACVKVLGFDSEEALIGKNVHQLIHHTHADGSPYPVEQCRIYTSYQTSEPIHVDDEVFWRPDGSCFAVEYHAYPISIDSKNEGAVVIFSDITKRKQIESELENYRENLEIQVEQRIKQLYEAQDELVRKERLATLGQLTVTVSHELRNPLGVMRPSLYVIQKKTGDVVDTHLQNAIERINRGIDRCDHIIDELLDFTRISHLKTQSMDLDHWLNALLDEHQLVTDVNMTRELNLNTQSFEFDPDRLRRALINVIDNACHSMLQPSESKKAKKGSQLTISTQVMASRVEIVITDNGKGIEDEVLPKIFEPLFSTKGFGVGLGMPTVKQIMGQHEGGIEITTKENIGTTVTLWLPLGDQQSLQHQHSESAES